MNRFARSTAIAGAALVALMLAIAASATTGGSDRSTAPICKCGGNELPHVRPWEAWEGQPEEVQDLHRLGEPAGRPGRDRRAGNGRRRARRQVRERPARRRRTAIRSHSSSASSSRTRRKARPAGRSSSTTSGSRSSRRAPSPRAPSRSSRRSARKKPVVTGVASPRSTERRRTPIVLFGDVRAHPPAVRHVREERPQGQDRGRRSTRRAPGITEAGADDRSGPEEGRESRRRPSATRRARPT